MKNKSSIIKLFLVFTIPLFLFQNCSKEIDEDVVTEEAIQDNSKLLEILKQWGYSEDDIEEYPNLYVASGDIVFYKNKEYLSPEDSNSSKEISSKGQNQKQRAYPTSVNINDINVYLNPGMDNDWISASLDAINRWNAVNCSTLNLIRVFNVNDADIEILNDTDETDPIYSFLPLNDATTFGMGDWPTLNGTIGVPGNKIWVNPNFNHLSACGSSMTQNNRISNVQHELGHNLGLMHTNQTGGTQIPGTPSTDSGSLMNGGQACSITDFSNYDEIAVKYLFPCPPPVSCSIVGPESLKSNCGFWTYNASGGPTGSYAIQWKYWIYNANNTLQSSGTSGWSTLALCLPIGGKATIELTVADGSESCVRTRTVNQYPY